ncbi:unnamed protein product, partial [Tuber aestivum]
MFNSSQTLSTSDVYYSTTPIDLKAPYNVTTAGRKTILITGGARGLGEGMLRNFAKLGATVIVGDLNETRGESVIAELRKSSGNLNVHFLSLDVTSYASQCEFFRSARKLSPTGKITTVIANAGVAELGSFIESSPTKIPLDVDPPEPDMTTVDVNFKGVLYTTKLALHHLRSSPVGQRELILVGSMSSFASGPMMAIYSATKHGVLGLFRSIRLFPSKRDGVRINMICPYFVDTPIVPIGGKVMLAGLQIAVLDDVVDAVSRLVCDEGIAGRCLAIAPPQAGGVIEVGVQEMENVDAFCKKVVKAMNMQSKMEIFTKFLVDIVWLLVVGPVLRLLRE